MKKTIALLGNPNCGKTTLFNYLTGTYQKTGNWTGVTTEKKTGFCRFNKEVEIIDLPGVYALDKGSTDENVVLEYLRNNKPDCIINVVDGTNLERNLYLTCELAMLNLPVVIAVSFYDEMQKNGFVLDVKKFSADFNVPVVLISAISGENVDVLLNEALNSEKSLKTQNLALFDSKTPAEKRYEIIQECVKSFLITKPTKNDKLTQKIDDVLTNKIVGFPIFLLIMTLIYFLTIKIGGFLGGYVSYFFKTLSVNTANSLSKIGVWPWLVDLICNAVIKGVGTVLSFLPQILVLFCLMTILEQSGYASRIALNLDRIFRTIGLGGKSFLPMMISCGCTVSGILATRTIEDEKEKIATIFLSPFMPCSAKMAVFAWFSWKFFEGRAYVATLMYLISLLSIISLGFILKRLSFFKKDDGHFILEIPTLRKPKIKDVLLVMWEKTKDFTAKAGSIIFLVSIGLWLLINFGFNGYNNGEIQNSFIYYLGNCIKYLFYPLGFGNWESSVAVISGFIAKEAVIETLEIVSKEINILFDNKWSILSFITFILLSPPCIASLATAKKELKSKKLLVGMIAFQLISGYFVALIINCIGILIEMGLLLSVLIVIILIISTFLCLIVVKRNKCKACNKCNKGELKCRERIKRNTI